MKKVTCALLTACVILTPSFAWADGPFDLLEDIVGDDNIPFVISSSTSTTSTSIAGGVAITIGIRQATRSASLRRFLEENNASVQQALVLDADGTGAELMAFYAPLFPELDEATWHRCLREERAALSAILAGSTRLEDKDVQAFDAMILNALSK